MAPCLRALLCAGVSERGGLLGWFKLKPKRIPPFLRFKGRSPVCGFVGKIKCFQQEAQATKVDLGKTSQPNKKLKVRFAHLLILCLTNWPLAPAGRRKFMCPERASAWPGNLSFCHPKAGCLLMVNHGFKRYLVHVVFGPRCAPLKMWSKFLG